jgi:hypothetical protein
MIMSVIAWKLFFMTLVARTNPDVCYSTLLSEDEWKALYSKIHQTHMYPKTPPPIKDAIRWIAQLGGFLDRKRDRDPGPVTGGDGKGL